MGSFDLRSRQLTPTAIAKTKYRNGRVDMIHIRLELIDPLMQAVLLKYRLDVKGA